MTPVTSGAALETLLAEIRDFAWLAFDTEFVRERTYFPHLCLVQLMTPATCAMIDVIACSDLAAFARFLAGESGVRIAHAARQDLEALARAGVAAPLPLFDTQVAAALLGYPDQVSYAQLVLECCGVTLDKSQTRTNWSQRPLSDAQLSYALDDVRYLGPLYARLGAELETAGRLDWLWEETSRLPQAVARAADPVEAGLRVRGAAALPGPAGARARALAVWREQAAQRSDTPRGWLLKEDVLQSLAHRNPGSLEELAATPGLAPATVRRLGGEILGVLTRAVEEAHPSPAEHWRLSAQGRALLGTLQKRVEACAADTRIAPALLATRRDLESLILGNVPARLVEGWRAGVIGEELRRLVGRDPGPELREPAQARP
jgi:ribonuclease D